MSVKLLEAKDRGDLLEVRRVQQTPLYPEILRRLTMNQKVTQVAVWAKTQKVDGPCARWTVGTWRCVLTSVRAAGEKGKGPPAAPQARKTAGSGALVQAVHDAIAEIVTPECTLKRAMIPSAHEVWNDIDQALQLIKSEKVLKYAFLRQQARVEKILAAEDSNTIPMVRLMQSEAGTKAINSLKGIGEAIRKLEIGEEWMRGKGGAVSPYGPYPGSLVPHGVAEKSEIARGMEKFDEIDRNLIREATMKVINMVQGETSGRYKAGGLDVDSGGAGAAKRAGSAEAAGKDVH